MASVCFYFHVHQPRRVKKLRAFDIGQNHDYFGDNSGTNVDNGFIIRKVAQKCYLPANRLMLELLHTYPEFRISYSITGVFIDQLEEYAPEVLESFQQLVDTGRVELINETYYHSLAFLHSPQEFKRQVQLQHQKLYQTFGVKPRIFRNTELIYNDSIASLIADMGYVGILTEGVDRILGWRSPNFVYAANTAKLPLLLKNYRLSDDIAFRFSSRDWSHYPLSANTFANWVSAINGNGVVVNLFMDYETFGEHQWEDTGIFEFMRALPSQILQHPDNNFVTPSEAFAQYQPVANLDIPDYISWADIERDLSAWVENSMQQEALRKIYALEEVVLATNDPEIIETWRRLQTSDHFYYMCTKWFADGDVHKYFSPYDSPYIAFLSYMNVLRDFQLRLMTHKNVTRKAGPKVQIPVLASNLA